MDLERYADEYKNVSKREVAEIREFSANDITFESNVRCLNMDREMEKIHGKRHMRPGPLVHVLSVRIQPRQDVKKPLAVYGRISVEHFDSTYGVVVGLDLYKRPDPSLAEVLDSTGTLTLNGPDFMCSPYSAIIPMFRNMINAQLFDEHDNVLAKVCFSLDDTEMEGGYEQVKSMCIPCEQVSLVVAYIAIPFGYSCRLEISFCSRKEKVPAGKHDSVNVNGKIVASCVNTYGNYSSEECVLFQKHSNDFERVEIDGAEMLLSRCWVALPAYSSLAIGVNLSEYDTGQEIVNGSVQLLVGPGPTSGQKIILDDDMYIQVGVAWFPPTPLGRHQGYDSYPPEKVPINALSSFALDPIIEAGSKKRQRTEGSSGTKQQEKKSKTSLADTYPTLGSDLGVETETFGQAQDSAMDQNLENQEFTKQCRRRLKELIAYKMSHRSKQPNQNMLHFEDWVCDHLTTLNLNLDNIYPIPQNKEYIKMVIVSMKNYIVSKANDGIVDDWMIPDGAISELDDSDMEFEKEEEVTKQGESHPRVEANILESKLDLILHPLGTLKESVVDTEEDDETSSPDESLSNPDIHWEVRPHKYKPFSSPAIEIFSIFVGREESKAVKLHGSIEVFSEDERICYLFKRDENDPLFVSQHMETALVPDGSRLYEDYNDLEIKFDMKDIGGNVAVKGYAKWDGEILDEDIHRDKQLCSFIQGEQGFLALHYSVFSDAVVACPKIFLILKTPSSDVYPKVYGSLTCQYRNHCYSSKYNRDYYRCALHENSG